MASITLKSSKSVAAGSLAAGALATSLALVHEPSPVDPTIAVNPTDGWYFLARSACLDFELSEDQGDFNGANTRKRLANITALRADHVHVEDATGGGKFLLKLGSRPD